MYEYKELLIKRRDMVEIPITSRQGRKGSRLYSKEYGKYDIYIISRISQFTTV